MIKREKFFFLSLDSLVSPSIADNSIRDTCDEDHESNFSLEDSSEDELDTQCDNLPSLPSQLACWSVNHRIPHSAINDLLRILKLNVEKELPLDARTLLNTPRTVNVLKKCGGEYIYHGIMHAIKKQPPHSLEQLVSLIVNIDGLPISKSSDAQFWPILGTINFGRPFVIALFSGDTKPTPVEDFLEDFLREISNLKEGFFLLGERKEFSLKIFTCDAPARQYLKSVKGHTGYNACERCMVVGELHNRVMTFEDISAPLRNDQDFHDFQYHPEHQHTQSILERISFPCVSNFVLDYMHLICLGVVRRMLNYLKTGPRICRISQHQLEIVSNKLESLRNALPSEFARQPRSLKYLKRWKATEFRQFLLYTGVFVLKGVISEEAYNHFLSLSISISILLSHDPEQYEEANLIAFAKDLLKWFVEKAPEIYGETFVSYNVHSIIHLPDDVEKHKAGLHKLSAFPFENFMQSIKGMLRKGNQPLAQVAKRLSEMEHVEGNFKFKTSITHISGRSNRNSWFLTSENKVCRVIEPIGNNKFLVDIVNFDRALPYFKQPIDSKLMNICLLPNTIRFRRVELSRSQFKQKFVTFQSEGGILLIPMLHILDSSV